MIFCYNIKSNIHLFNIVNLFGIPEAFSTNIIITMIVLHHENFRYYASSTHAVKYNISVLHFIPFSKLEISLRANSTLLGIFVWFSLFTLVTKQRDFCLLKRKAKHHKNQSYIENARKFTLIAQYWFVPERIRECFYHLKAFYTIEHK